MKENKMEQWKKEYEAIPVPGETKARVEAGIRQARGKKQPSRIIRSFRTAGAAAAACLILLTTAVNSSEALAASLAQVPVLGAIARVVTVRTYENKTNQLEARVEVPAVETESQIENPEVQKNVEMSNAQIEAYANQFIADYEAEVREANGEGNYALESSYEVLNDSEKYLTIRVNTTVVMASGAQYVKIFHVDKATGALVTLRDLFADPDTALAAVSENIRQQMEAQMAQDENKVYFIQSADMPDGFEGLTGAESFSFNEAGELVIFFNEYEVAPGYMGAVSFTIPAQVTAGLTS